MTLFLHTLTYFAWSVRGPHTNSSLGANNHLNPSLLPIALVKLKDIKVKTRRFFLVTHPEHRPVLKHMRFITDHTELIQHWNPLLRILHYLQWHPSHKRIRAKWGSTDNVYFTKYIYIHVNNEPLVVLRYVGSLVHFKSWILSRTCSIVAHNCSWTEKNHHYLTFGQLERKHIVVYPKSWALLRISFLFPVLYLHLVMCHGCINNIMDDLYYCCLKSGSSSHLCCGVWNGWLAVKGIWLCVQMWYDDDDVDMTVCGCGAWKKICTIIQIKMD